MEWQRRTCTCRRRKSEGHWWLHPLHQQVSIWSSTPWALLIDAPVRERAAGAWRRPSISFLHKSLCLLLSAHISLSLWLSIIYHLSISPCPSLSHISTSLLLLSTLTTQFRSSKSLKYSLRLIGSILLHCLKYLSPSSFRLLSPPRRWAKPPINLTSGPWGWWKNEGTFYFPSFTDLLFPSSTQIHPSHPPLSAFHLLSWQSLTQSCVRLRD